MRISDWSSDVCSSDLTQGQQSTPAFIQGGTLGDSRERSRLDNPFLNADARALIASELLAGGLRSNSLTSRTALSAADIAAIADGSFRFVTARLLDDLGRRAEDRKSTRTNSSHQCGSRRPS